MPAQEKYPLMPLSLVLLRPSVTKADDALNADVKVKSLAPTSSFPAGTRLFYRQRGLQTVGWQKHVAPVFLTLPDLKSQQADAALVFPVGNRWCAALFGIGRALISQEKAEPDFGFQVALRLCDPDNLSIMDYRTIEERTRIGRVKLSGDGGINAFRLDTDTDLLRGVAGPCKGGSPWERVSATGPSLSMSVRDDIHGLVEIAAKLLKERTKPLHQDFQWVDHVRRVRDPASKQLLDTALGKLIDQGKLTNIRLSIPDIREDGVLIEGRLFKEDGPVFDSNVSNYLASRPGTSADTIDAMKRHELHLFDVAAGASRESLPVYRCLVAEITLKGKLYLLIDGEWFGLQKDYVADVNAAMAAIPVLDMRTQLRAWTAGEAEGDYNEDTCTTSLDLAPLDKKTLTIGDKYSRVEPADWLSTKGVFGHVKRRDKNSSGLSHLFAQGLVSGDILFNHGDFRARVAGLLDRPRHGKLKNALLKATFDSQAWTIAYVLLGADCAAPSIGLPFFSKVNLRKQYRLVRNMGYKCALVGA